MVKKYYVSAINGSKRFVICGPFRTHKEALKMVKPIETYANLIDPRAHFMAWGTCSSEKLLKCAISC